MKPLFSLLVASALALLALGCRGEGLIEADLNRSDALPPGLILEVGVGPSSIGPGESADIRVTLRNLSEDLVTLHFESDCQVLYLVEDAAGDVVRPEGGSWPCTPGATTLRIHPNMFHREEFQWDGSTEQGRLPAGEYRVYGAVGREMTIRSTPVTLTIR